MHSLLRGTMRRRAAFAPVPRTLTRRGTGILRRSAVPYVVNVDGSDLQKLLDSCYYGSFNGWSPSGEQVAFTLLSKYGPANVYAVKAGGTGAVNLTNSPFWNVDPEWLPRRWPGSLTDLRA